MILITKEGCKACQEVKDFIDENNLKDYVNYVDIKSPDGMVLQWRYEFKCLPAMVDKGKNFNEVFRTSKAILKRLEWLRNKILTKN